jgi:hypothetical protein
VTQVFQFLKLKIFPKQVSPTLYLDVLIATFGAEGYQGVTVNDSDEIMAIYQFVLFDLAGNIDAGITHTD